eukprot:10485875-Heterocapsa_arctica.AAC.1
MPAIDTDWAVVYPLRIRRTLKEYCNTFPESDLCDSGRQRLGDCNEINSRMTASGIRPGRSRCSGPPGVKERE